MQLSNCQTKKVILKNKFGKFTHREVASYFSVVFGVDVSSRNIGNILASENKIMSIDDENKMIRKTMPAIPDIEKALNLWIDNACRNNIVINDEILTEMAKKFGEKMSLPADFKFSRGWLQRFKKRHNLKMINLHGEAGSGDLNIVENAKIDLRKKLDKFKNSCIYNLDETALFYEVQPSKTICSLVKKLEQLSQIKECL